MTEPRRERQEWAPRKVEHAVSFEDTRAPEATETTLVTLAQRWAAGEISLDEAMCAARRLTYPVRREADDGHWFDGEQDNTIQAVQALVGTGLTFEQFAKFSEEFAEI
mgnify:CR=1 FL=1